MIKEELEKMQPVVYQVLKNALNNNRLSHCYLFTGPRGTLKHETAILLAQSLVCENTSEGWGCGECIQCKRIRNGSYADFIRISGKDGVIKNQDILNLQSQFYQTALEKAGRKIFIISECENMTVKSANSLLKFIEEPSSSLTGIFITEQPERVLPTIVSRCQTINFRPINKTQLYQKAIEAGCDELAAHLISQMISRPEEIIVFNSNPAFRQVLMVFCEFMHKYLVNLPAAVIYLQEDALKGSDRRNSQELLSIFLSIAVIFVNDYHNDNSIDDQTWAELLKLARDNNFDSAGFLAAITEARNALNYSVNIPLLIDQMLYKLSGGTNEQ